MRSSFVPVSAALVLWACSPSPPPEAPATIEAPPAWQARIQSSWAAAAEADPQGVTALLDAPGGAGWIPWFEGDLPAAEAAFGTSDSASARLGRAHAHLAWAEAWIEARRLHLQAAQELARWRLGRGDQVRSGAYEPWSLAIATGDLLQGPPGEGGDPAVRAALRALAEQGDRPDEALSLPEALPPVLAARLRFAAAAARGQEPAPADLAAARSFEPDFVDPRGEDDGITFEVAVHSPRTLRGLARYHLARAAHEASGLGDAGEAVRRAVAHGWGAPAPRLSGSAGDEVPPWAGLFLSASPDLDDWTARWSRGAAGRALGQDLARADADGALRESRILADAVPALLKPPGPAAGLALELDLGQRFADRALRAHADTLAEGPDASSALRLLDRAFDAAAPGSRVARRNDRAGLLRRARTLLLARRTGEALDIVHALDAAEPGPLAGVRGLLVRLDAAGTVGQRGKAQQL